MKPFQELNVIEMQKVLEQLPEHDKLLIEGYEFMTKEGYIFKPVECGICYTWELVE